MENSIKNKNFKAQAMVSFYNGGLAGNGIRFHISFEYNYYKQKCINEWKIPFVLISRKVENFQGFECSLIGTPPNPDYVFDSSDDIKEIYNKSFTCVLQAFEDLYDKGKTDILFLQRGYTSFGLWAAKRAQEVLSARDKEINLKIVWTDSSDPDTDELNYDLDFNSIPVSRFYPMAYENTIGLIYNWHNNPLPQKRQMPGITHRQMVSHPYPPKYLQWLKDITKISKKQAREQLKQVFPFRNFEILDSDLLIPMMSSGGVWLKENVGKWMTKPQFESVITCTKNILYSLQKSAEAENKKVFLPVAPECIQVMEKDFKKCKNIIPIEFTVISQENIMYLYLASDMVIQRAHTISASQSAAIKQLVLITLMPAEGYMDGELISQDVIDRKLGIVLDWQDKELGGKIYDIIKKLDSPEIMQIRENGFDEFYSFHEGKNNVLNVVQKLAGF